MASRRLTSAEATNELPASVVRRVQLLPGVGTSGTTSPFATGLPLSRSDPMAGTVVSRTRVRVSGGVSNGSANGKSALVRV